MFDFDDPQPQEQEVKYKGERYILREATEGAARAYRNAGQRSYRMTDGKLSHIEGAADVEPLLVSMCLCKTDADGAVRYKTDRRTPMTVDLETVLTWPSRVVRPMFEWVKRVSDLDEATEESLKEQIKQCVAIIRKIREKKRAEGNGRTAERSGTATS